MAKLRKRVGCEIRDKRAAKEGKPTEAVCTIGFLDEEKGTFIETGRKEVIINPQTGSTINTLSIRGETAEDINLLNSMSRAVFAQKLKDASE